MSEADDPSKTEDVQNENTLPVFASELDRARFSVTRRLNGGTVSRTHHHWYTLDALADKADEVQGDLPEHPVIVLVEGTSAYVPHISTRDPTDLPAGVVETIRAEYGDEVEITTDVEMGWSSWGGRPEFADSRSYVQYRPDDDR